MPSALLSGSCKHDATRDLSDERKGLVVPQRRPAQQRDFVFDPATASWGELPPDPLSPSFDRSMAWSGRELLLFDHELVPNPGSEEPSLTRAAALDIESSWRRLPDSEILATEPWAVVNGRLVNPHARGRRRRRGRQDPQGASFIATKFAPENR